MTKNAWSGNLFSASNEIELVARKSIWAVAHIVSKLSSFRAVDNDDREQIKTERHSCEGVNWQTEQFYKKRFNGPRDEEVLENKNLSATGRHAS